MVAAAAILKLADEAGLSASREQKIRDAHRSRRLTVLRSLPIAVYLTALPDFADMAGARVARRELSAAQPTG
ncbi:hypothetical protein [Cryobacterium sp. CG_9.6]|uniref:hypothetical protein n=1 Tax=Cryobacterium sp. CG_9.6 TaxID=2760710 RepID=UPI00247699B6|nr:hypothetical protein [Cryobacterium sp. CG_9.6]MDH6238169.1 hypothetical protein [Cryobacterium sp. CG_9.6]